MCQMCCEHSTSACLFTRACSKGGVIKLGDKIQTGSSSISIFGECVIKKTSQHSGDVPKELCNAIDQEQAPCLASSVSEVKINRRKELTVHLAPVGFCGVIPDGLAEKRAAGRCVLEALRWLL